MTDERVPCENCMKLTRPNLSYQPDPNNRKRTSVLMRGSWCRTCILEAVKREDEQGCDVLFNISLRDTTDKDLLPDIHTFGYRFVRKGELFRDLRMNIPTDPHLLLEE